MISITNCVIIGIRDGLALTIMNRLKYLYCVTSQEPLGHNHLVDFNKFEVQLGLSPNCAPASDCADLSSDSAPTMP